MTNTVKKNSASKPFKWLFKDNYQFVLAFFIPFGILLLAYICFGVYPVNKSSVLSLDLNGQYVYYFDYMYDVFSGKESLFYSWSRSLSGEFMGIIGYYLASPFNFLVWIFPRVHITEGLLAMLVTKAGAIGVCSAVYFYRGRGFSKSTTVIFSMMYALCSYTIVQTMNPMWLDGVMALPLVIYGVQSLIRYGRFRMLIFALIYSFITCFYIGYMIGIFTAVYFLYYFFASNNFGKLEPGAVLARIGLFFISSVTAILCSCFVVLPVVNSLSLGKFDFSVPDYSIKSNFNLISLLNKLLPNSYDTVRMEGLPFLYVGILSVIMLVCFFIGTAKANKNTYITIRKRIASVVLLIFLTTCMYITPVDMLWHGGQLPNWLPYRYSFILSFLILSFGAEAFERLSDYPKKLIGGISAGFFAVMIYLESTDTFNETLGKEGRDTLDGITVILPAVLILIIIAAMLIQWHDKIGKKRAYTVTLGIIVGCELFYNTLMGVVKQDIDIVYSTRDSYVNVIEPTRQVVAELTEKELSINPNAIFRIEKDYFRTVNDPLAANMYGLSHSSSTLNSKPIELLGQLGLTSRSHYTRYSGATPLIDDLFGIKYILSTSGNETGKIESKDDIIIEENTDAMPIAYLVDKLVEDLKLDSFPSDNLNVFQRQNRILSTMLGKTYVEDYIKIIGGDSLELETENVKYGSASGGHTSYKVETPGKNAQIEYTLTAAVTGEMFLWMPTDYERKLNVWVNKSMVIDRENAVESEQEIEVEPNLEIEETESAGVETVVDIWKGNLYETDNYCIKSLGEFTEGEEFSVTLTLTKDDLYFKEIYFAYFDEELYKSAIAELHAMNNETEVEKITPTHLKIHTNSEKEQLLFTTIPVEPGWTVTLDGGEVEYKELFGVVDDKNDGEGSLIGINVLEGRHIIEMKFTTGYYPLALYLSGGGLVLLALMLFLGYKLNKAHKNLELNDGDYEDDNESNYDVVFERKGIDLSFTPENRNENKAELLKDIQDNLQINDEHDKENTELINTETEDAYINENAQELTEEVFFDTEIDIPAEPDITEKTEEETEHLDDMENTETDLMFSKEEIADSEFADLMFIDGDNQEETALAFDENTDTAATDDYGVPPEYDREKVKNNINLILNEINEINEIDTDGIDDTEMVFSEIKDDETTQYAGSAEDLFPDDEIEKLNKEN